MCVWLSLCVSVCEYEYMYASIDSYQVSVSRTTAEEGELRTVSVSMDYGVKTAQTVEEGRRVDTEKCNVCFLLLARVVNVSELPVRERLQRGPYCTESSPATATAADAASLSPGIGHLSSSLFLFALRRF